MRSSRSRLLWLLAGLAGSCAPSPIIRPTVAAEPVGVVNDTAFFYTAYSAAGLETGREVSIDPHRCVVVDPPHGAGELRVRVTDMDQRAVLDLSGEQLRSAWAACSCGGRSVAHCVRIPPPPPPDTGRH